MKKVHILPPDIISKIAAGEVIDRPASVVKELMENAIDAKSDSIELTLQQAGKQSIHIKDTGTGIAREDIADIFHRHATSKIATIDDLFNIHSLGFRGEALYSIAAIADIIVRSRTKEQDEGWEIHMRGGKQINLRPTPLNVGAEIEIQELFFNTPARRKFLKSNIAELNQILNVFIPYCLLYPRTRFFLKNQDKILIDLKPQEDYRERMTAVLNLNAGHLLECRHDFPDQNLSLNMILGDINIVRHRRDMQFIFINNRPVQSKNISYHMNNIYRLILPPDNFPCFALFVDLPAEDVDVNIHPAKREVKIKDENKLCSLLRHLCENTLMSAGKPKQAQAATEFSSTQNNDFFKPADPRVINRALAQTDQKEHTDTIIPSPFKWQDASPSSGEPRQETARRQPTEKYSFPQSDPARVDKTLFAQKNDSLKERLTRARFIGSFMNKFLFFDAGKVLLVVDQHAAQERVTFEMLIQQMENSRIEVQRLLSPYLVALEPRELTTWEEAKNILEEMGFESTQFDDQTIAVHTYPVLIKDVERAVRDILSGGNAARCDHESLARRACRASVMAGDKMDARQAAFQREALIKCRDPFTCPHGRPTVVEMSEGFLDKQFLRA